MVGAAAGTVEPSQASTASPTEAGSSTSVAKTTLPVPGASSAAAASATSAAIADRRASWLTLQTSTVSDPDNLCCVAQVASNSTQARHPVLVGPDLAPGNAISRPVEIAVAETVRENLMVGHQEIAAIAVLALAICDRQPPTELVETWIDTDAGDIPACSRCRHRPARPAHCIKVSGQVVHKLGFGGSCSHEYIVRHAVFFVDRAGSNRTCKIEEQVVPCPRFGHHAGIVAGTPCVAVS